MTHPRIASNTPHGEDTIHVCYVFKDGRRATVSVPRNRWVAGGHAPVGPAIAAWLTELDSRAAARRAIVTGSADQQQP